VDGGETIFAIVGVLALLVGACELAVRQTRQRVRANRRLPSIAPAADYACPRPRLDPEIEELRRKGAL
jgi:hypothetical protein